MFGFQSKYSRNILIDTAIHYGDWISVHTDPRFGGSFDDIHIIRQETKKPILAKGFHIHYSDIQKCFDLGADYVLTVQKPSEKLNSFYSNGLLKNIIFEIDNINDISNVNQHLMRYCYNGRSLKTGFGKKYIGDYQQFRDRCDWLCGASLIKELDDVQKFYPKCDAFIIGQNLVEFCKDYAQIITL